MRIRRKLLGIRAVVIGGVMSAQDATIDPTFNPTDVGMGYGSGGSVVSAVAAQSDGKTLLVGGFFTFNAVPRRFVARVNADGTLDTGFDPVTGAGSSLSGVAVLPDGKILIYGVTGTYNGIPFKGIARLSANGSLDPSFDPGTGVNSTTSVVRIALQADGKIIIVGTFTSYNGTTLNRVARLNADGSLDASFDPGSGANAYPKSVIVQPDGRILIAGDFTTINGVARNRIARLNADGSLDTAFDPGSGANSLINHAALQADGRILISGWFTSYNGSTRNRIARLNANGTLDSSFDPGAGANAVVEFAELQADGKVVVGGDFTTFNGSSRVRLARLNANGTLDPTYASGAGASAKVYAAIPMFDGKIIIAGSFSSYNGHGVLGITRTEANGTADHSFNYGTGANATITRTVVLNDGKSLIVGAFTSFNDTGVNHIARLTADGQLDPTFSIGSGDNGSINTVCIQPDQKILIAGNFSSYNGVARNSIARLNADGTLDTSFDPGTGAQFGTSPGLLYALALRSDGKIMIGGFFWTYNGVMRASMARLNANGTLDTSFDPGLPSAGGGSEFRAITPLPDGKCLIAGQTITYNGSPGQTVMRVNANGALDAGFTCGIPGNYEGKSITLLADGKILVTGSFFYSSLGTKRGIARLNANGSLDTSFDPGAGVENNAVITGAAVLPDGKILAYGNFSTFAGTARKNLALLNENGSLNTTFDPGVGPDQAIGTAAMLNSGRILISGSFTTYSGTGRNRIARLMGTARTNIRVMLEGPYASGSMSDALRTLPSFPLTEPFTAQGYSRPVYVPGAAIHSAILTTTGNNAIVDWVIVEMRLAATPSVVAASRAVLLQRDGDIVDLDGVSTVGFSGLAPGNYCVAVISRNHLPVMLSPSTPVAYGGAVATVDFTLPSTALYNANASKNVSGTMLVKAGDVTFDATLSYVGLNNDRDPILVRVGGSTPTATVSGYYREDVNMDGIVKYVGAANDRDPILLNIGGSVPTATVSAPLP